MICENVNSRGISLRSVVGKLFRKMLIKRVRDRTECVIGRSNVSLGRVEDAWTMFAVRQISEKYLANGKDVFWRLWI